uniref:Oxygen sensor histidine kinase NreB n=1 Tax=Litorilinea aerophila TaxID=1204385 RepID=A0A540V8C4_9CHLR
MRNSVLTEPGNATRIPVESQLRTSRRFLQSALDALPSKVAILDRDGALVAVNAAWREHPEIPHGAGGSSPIGQNYLAALAQSVGDPQIGDAIHRGLQELLTGARTSFQVEYGWPDGENPHSWYELRASRFHVDQDTYIVVVQDDITARKEAEQALLDAAALRERSRLARELHDSVTQALYSSVLYIEAVRLSFANGQANLVEENLQELHAMIRQAIADMRLLIFELRPPILDEVGLTGALQARLEAVEVRSGIHPHLRITGDVPRLSEAAEVENELYRIIQEALNNMLKHAQASQVFIDLHVAADRVRLTIQDDGVGFDPASQEAGGMGIRNMKERAQQLGGELAIYSCPGQGTQIQVEVPL